MSEALIDSIKKHIGYVDAPMLKQCSTCKFSASRLGDPYPKGIRCYVASSIGMEFTTNPVASCKMWQKKEML